MRRFIVTRASLMGVTGAALIALAACTSDRPSSAPTRAIADAASADDAPPSTQPPAIRALWQPRAPILPSPNDLARDAQSGRLALPIDPSMSSAQQEFNAYLNRLDGYPLSATMRIPLSGAIEEPGLGAAFFAQDAATGAPVDVAVRFDADTNRVEAKASAGVQPGRRYVFGLRGYEGGVRGTGGEPVIADTAFEWVRARAPLNVQTLEMPGASEQEKFDMAQELRAIQRDYAPLIEQVTASLGFEREQLAVLSAFTMSTEPAVVFDPANGEIPMPNQLLIDPVSGLVELPIAPDDPAEARHLKEVLSTYDGFSISGALVLKSTHPLDLDSVMNPASIRLFQKHEDGSFSEVTDLERGVLTDQKTAWIRPRLTLKADTDYVYIATKDLKDTRHQPLVAQPLGALLRSKAPLLDAAGASQVSALDDAGAKTLEPVRRLGEPLLDALQSAQVLRQDLGAALPFHTQSAAQPLMARRAELYTRDVRTDLVNVEAASPLERGLWLSMPFVKTVVTGQMFTLDALDPRTRVAWADGHAEERATSFVLTIPVGLDKDEPVPVVLFGHGLMTSRELTYLIANKLAGAGYAVFSLDLPYHGDRAVCLEDGECAGSATCDALGACVNADGSAGQVARIRVPFVDAEFPISTGFAFIDVENLVGTRDHFAQALLDLMQGLRVIQGADWARYTGGYRLDGDDIVYLGMSLGGILGANMAALEPGIQDFVLNVPGAGFLSLIENSQAFTSIFNASLARRDAPPGSDAYFEFANIIRWLLDPVDPLNIAHHATREPLQYVDPEDGQLRTMPPKRVLIQMAKNDAVVPNIATQILAERMGLTISEYEPSISNHGFLFDPVSLSGRAARDEIVAFFDARD